MHCLSFLSIRCNSDAYTYYCICKCMCVYAISKTQCFLWVFVPFTLSLCLHTPHFLLNKEYKLNFLIILSHFGASYPRKIIAEMRKGYLFGLKSFNRCLSSCMSLICLSDLSIVTGLCQNWGKLGSFLSPATVHLGDVLGYLQGQVL